MVRPKKVDIRVAKTLSLELDIYKEFEELVGAGKVSEEIRAMIKDRVEQSKNEEGMLTPNPLALPVGNTNSSKDSRQSKLFEHFDKSDMRDQICKFIEQAEDMTKLDTLYRNCNTVVGVIKTRKQHNHVLAQAQQRNRITPNEEIVSQLKRSKRFFV